MPRRARQLHGAYDRLDSSDRDVASLVPARRASILPVLAKVARDMPVRLLIGDKDRIVGTADLGKLSPEIAVHRFADTGHMPHWENPVAVVNILLAARCHRWQP